MLRFSTFLLPLALAALTIFAYRPLFNSPADDWGMLHGDFKVFHSAQCLKQRLNLPCLLWMIDGRAATELGAFEPLTWLLHSILLTLNNNFLPFHSWHVVSLIIHIFVGWILLFCSESLLYLLDERDPQGHKGAFRIPVFIATAFWLVSPQRVENILWASAFSIPWSALWATVSLACFLRSISHSSAWRFLSWLTYIAATWSSATVLPLAFVFVLLEAWITLPRERAIALARRNAKAEESKDSKQAPDEDDQIEVTVHAPFHTKRSIFLDLLAASFRCGLFLLGWGVSFFLTSLATMRSQEEIGRGVEAMSVSELFLEQFRAYIDPSTILPRIIRSMLALAWHTRQWIYPHDLHQFQTRHVALIDERPERLLVPANQQELIDVCVVVTGLIILVACALKRRQGVWVISIGSFLMFLLPSIGLFTSPNDLSSSSKGLHPWVSDRFSYIASAFLIPFIASFIVRDDAPVELTSSASPAVGEKEHTKEKGDKKASKDKKSVAVVSSSSTTTPASADPVVPSRKQPMYRWFNARLILAVLLASTGVFVLHVTPEEVDGYRSLPGLCARVLQRDSDVVECHEILGITFFREAAAPTPLPGASYAKALQHLDRLVDLESRSLVALVCRATIYAEGALANREKCDESFAYALTVQPDNPYVLVAQARVMWARQDPEAAAMNVLERCISRNPDYTEAYFLLSDIARSINDTITSDAYRGQGEMIQKNLRNLQETGEYIDADSSSSRREGLTKVTNAAGEPIKR